MTFDWIFAGDAHAHSVVGEAESAVGARLKIKKELYMGCDRRPQIMVRRALLEMEKYDPKTNELDEGVVTLVVDFAKASETFSVRICLGADDELRLPATKMKNSVVGFSRTMEGANLEGVWHTHCRQSLPVCQVQIGRCC